MTFETTVSKRSQTAVPSRLCRKYGIKSGAKIVWMDLGDMICVMPVPTDPVKSFRGSSKGLYKALLTQRKKERRRDNAA